MKGNKCDILVSKRQFRLLTFEEKKHVLNNFKTYNLNANDKLALINSLPNKIRLNELEIIFKCPEFYHVTKEELIVIFKELNYEDKMHLLDVLNNYEIQNDLLDTLTEKEIYNFFKEPPMCSNQEIRDYLAIKLSPETCITFFNKLPKETHVKQKISLLKNIPESIQKNFLEKNKHRLIRYTGNYSEEVQEISASIISRCLTEEEKIACLKKPNKYNIDLTRNERRAIIETLSDDIKLKIIKEEDFHKYNYYSYNAYENEIICRTLSDQTLISLINDQDFIDRYFDGEVSNIISLLSSSACLELLKNRPKYLCLYNPDNLLELLKKLPLNEKKLLLDSNNKYHITLDEHEVVELIKTFPDEDKISIFNENKLNLEISQLEEIILSVKYNILINYLLTGKLNIKYISTLTIIINYLAYDLSNLLLKSHNNNLQNFAERHRKTIINNMRLNDQIGIINRPNDYSLKLTDKELITVLINLSKISNDVLESNLLTRFKDSDYFVDYFINNLPKFTAINEKYQKQIVKYYIKKNNLSVDEDFIYQVLRYNSNGKILFKNYQQYKNFLNTLNINMDDFIQYAINSHKIKYLEVILTIINNKKTENLNKLLDYLFHSYYHNPNTPRDTIKAFLEVIYLYHTYPQFSKNIINNPEDLTKENHGFVSYLLHQNIPLKNIQNFSDIKKHQESLITNYHNSINDQSEISTLRCKLSQLLFSKTDKELANLLTITGREEDIEILKFNNRHNVYFASYCDDLLIITNLIEQIISTKDIELLRKYILYFTDKKNHNQTKIICNYCLKYEENIRKLYEYDLNITLTKIKDIPIYLKETENALKFKRKYGGEVIDLSNTNYVLGAHIKSDRETIETIINGTSDGSKNYISLSAISHRNQQYYYMWGDKTPIFAYDNIPKDSFICSASNNLGTNHSLQQNTLEIPLIYRRQKGILETSQCEDREEQNSEILMYRENLRPVGIIVPLDNTPSKEAIKYHKKYQLPFIITQAIGKTISNPERIPKETKKLSYIIANDEEISALRKMQQDLSNLKTYNPRRIAVITDPHALYEPTLAALIDIKHQGINEIYSLGDNIGHGPNPKEVLELLDRFNVKSVYGNHELYLQENSLKNFQGHFPSDESIERTLAMLKWMRQELTDRDITKISNYPERYELNIEGTNPLTLIHTTKNYTEHGKYAYTPNILPNSYVVQGHEHFANKNNNQDIVLRGVGIGQNYLDDGMASYAIIEIKDNSYNIENRYVLYNRQNLLHTINESTMPSSAKQLIKRWVGK